MTTALDVLHTGSAAFTSTAVSDQVHESIVAAVAVGDLDRRRRARGGGGVDAGPALRVLVDGRAAGGFPVSTTPAFSAPAIRNEANRLDPGFIATPALGDLDRDGKLEIVIGSMDRHLYVWREDGTPQPGSRS